MIAEVTTYNGWTNRETWLASLWLNCAEDGYTLLRDVLNIKENKHDKADLLEAMLQDQLYDQSEVSNLWQDLLSTAFGRINWVEVIENNL